MGVVSAIKVGVDGILDLLYPPHCLLCGAWGGAALCGACIAQIQPVDEPICPRCGQSMTGGICNHCSARTPAFARARSLGAYDGVLRRSIHRLKYRDRPQLTEPLAHALAAYARENASSLGDTWDLVVPVPMTPARERVRGYNQAARIARALASELGVAFRPKALRRTRSTRAQVGLTGAARQANLAGAFSADRTAVEGKIVLLLDDVATTGSTLHECASALKASGAKTVYALTLAAG